MGDVNLILNFYDIKHFDVSNSFFYINKQKKNCPGIRTILSILPTSTATSNNNKQNK
jgi:hypothetical protein